MAPPRASPPRPRSTWARSSTELTVSEAALLAAIPQAPGTLYPWYKDDGRYVNIVKERGKKLKNGRHNVRFVLKTCPDNDAKCADPLVERRDYILGRLHDGKGRWTTLSDEQYQQALDERIVIKKPKSVVYKAPHFVNALLPELDRILGDRKPLKSGGYTVITTLDWKAQQLGEKYIEAGAYIPNLPASKYYQAIQQRKLGRDAFWIGDLRGSSLHNGALVAMDYRTGDILAYVGSAGYYRRATPAFAPKVDHVGGSWRQPGSAWKPIVYTTGIDTRRLTAGTYLLDKQEAFGPGWTPRNASGTYQGYIRVRDAIQQSLNIPAIRALQATGIVPVRRYALKAGYTFLPKYGNRALDVAGLAGALGTVEVRPLDMTAAFGAFGNGGKVTQPRYIQKVLDADGNVIYAGSEARHDAGLVAAGRLHHGRHPRGQHEHRREPGLGCGLRDAQHHGRLAPRGGGQDGHDQRSGGLLDLRHPADAQEREAARARGRRVVRKQRQLEPQPQPPALLAGQRRPDLGGLRARLHEQQARPRLQATARDRQLWGGALHPGHATRRPPAGGLWRDAGHT